MEKVYFQKLYQRDMEFILNIIQDSANQYKIIKRSDEGLAYIDVTHGKRARGLMYVGAENCGLALGLKNFRQKYPYGLEVNNLGKKQTSATP